jgi:hypothetical protein
LLGAREEAKITLCGRWGTSFRVVPATQRHGRRSSKGAFELFSSHIYISYWVTKIGRGSPPFAKPSNPALFPQQLLSPPFLRHTHLQGRRGNSFKPKSPQQNITGGAAALAAAASAKKPASAKKEKDERGGKGRHVEKPKLNYVVLALIAFAVIMYPLLQLFGNNVFGRGANRFPGRT